MELAESPLVLRLAAEAERHKAIPLPVSWLHRIELVNALQLHVSSALLLGCDTFWSFDPKALALAAREGLRTPTTHLR